MITLAASENPTKLPSGTPDDGKQLSLLLDAAKNMVDQEINRSDRLDAKARNQFTAAGGLFAVVMAATAGVLNALLDETNVSGWVYPVLGGAALASILGLFIALAWSREAWKTHPTDALDPETIEQYVSYAEDGVVAVGKNLIRTYAQILRDRRAKNATRAADLKKASVACLVASLASLAQLAAVFVALISK